MIDTLGKQSGRLSRDLQVALPTVGRSQSYNADSIKNYVAQPGFDGMGFDPYDEVGNNARYASKQTWGNTLSKSFDDFGHKFSGSFVGNFTNYDNMARAVWNLDWNEMDLTEDEKIQQYYLDQQNEAKNHIFQTPEEDEKFFNKQFVKDMLGNSGFALGTFAAMGLELAADAALEAFTFGGATPVVLAEGASMMSRLGKAGSQFFDGMKSVRNLDEGLDAARGLRSMGNVSRTAERTMSAVHDGLRIDLGNEARISSLYEKVGKAFEYLPVVGTAPKYLNRMRAAVAAGESPLKVAGIGAAGFRRGIIELNMAASEAAFESVTTYGDTLDRLIEQHRSQNGGQAPDKAQLERMREYARNASSSNYHSNMGILLVSNKIQFGNIFSKFTPANKLMRDLTEETAENVVKVTGRIAGKESTRLFEKGFFGTYGQLGKIAGEFGKREAAWQGLKTLGKDALRLEVLEGLQENLQETSATGWRNYYVNAYKNTPQSLSDAMGEGLGEQFTQQGFKTFLMGAFTGSIIHGVTAPTSKGIQKLQDMAYTRGGKESPMERARASTRADIETLNALFKDPSSQVFSERDLNFNQQVQASAEMTDAAREGRAYEWHNAKENSLLATAVAARRLNMLPALTREIREAGKHFTPEQFQEAFNIDLKDTKYESVGAFTDKVAKDLESYVKEIDGLKRILGPVLDPMRYKDPNQQYAAHRYNQTIEKAIEVIALNKIKGGLAKTRAEEVLGKLTEVEGFGSMSQWLSDSLGSHDKHFAELASVTQKIAIVQDNLKEQVKAKRASGNDGITYDPVQHEKVERELEELKELEQLMKDWKGYFRSERTDEETGQELDFKFVGKRGKVRQATRLEDGTLTEEEIDADLLNHPEVKETFRKLSNLRVKQGLPYSTNTQPLTDTSVEQGFDLFTDYLRLDQDAREYLDAASQLIAPDAFVAHHARIYEGYVKATAQQYLDQLHQLVGHLAYKHLFGSNPSDPEEMTRVLQSGADDPRLLFLAGHDDRLKQAREAVWKIQTIRDIETLYLTPDLGVNMSPHLHTLMNQSEAGIQKALEEVLGPAHGTDVIVEEAAETPEAPEDNPAAPEPAPVTPTQPTPPASPELLEAQMKLVTLLAEEGSAAAQNEYVDILEAYPTLLEDLEDQVAEFQAYVEAQTEALATQQEVDAWIAAAIQQQRDAITKLTEEAQPAAPDPAPTPEPPRGQRGIPGATPMAPEPGDNKSGAEPTNETLSQNAARGAAHGFNQAAAAAGNDGYLAVVERISKSGPFTVTKAASIAAFKGDARYHTKENPDGSLQVVGVQDPDDGTRWHGEAPAPPTAGPDPVTVTVDPATQTAGVTDRAGNPVTTGQTPEEAGQVATVINTTSADRDFILGHPKLLNGDRTLLDEFFPRAQAAVEKYNKSKGTDFKSLEEFYNTRPGKMSLDTILRNLRKQPAPETSAPIEPLSTEMPSSQGPATFSDPVITGIRPDLSESDMQSFYQRAKSYLESSAESTTFAQTVTEQDVLDELDKALTCFL